MFEANRALQMRPEHQSDPFRPFASGLPPNHVAFLPLQTRPPGGLALQPVTAEAGPHGGRQHDSHDAEALGCGQVSANRQLSVRQPAGSFRLGHGRAVGPRVGGIRRVGPGGVVGDHRTIPGTADRPNARRANGRPAPKRETPGFTGGPQPWALCGALRRSDRCSGARVHFSRRTLREAASAYTVRLLRD
jgi:hypothetical protein